MTILITGGAGFIGSHLVEACLAAGHAVHVVDNLSGGRKENLPKGVELHELDVRSPELVGLMQRVKPGYVAHLAAQVSVVSSQREPAVDASVNIVGSLNALLAARKSGAERFLFTSSAAVFGGSEVPLSESTPVDPQSPYGLAKHTVERYLAREGDFAVVVRPANVYGPRQRADTEAGVVAKFCSAAAAQQPLVVEGSGEQTRDFIYVTDVAAGMLAALERGRGVYHVGTGQETSIRQLANATAELAVGSVPVTFGPARATDVARSVFTIERAQRELGWQPKVGFRAGLKQTLGWYEKGGI
jgi:UDP-glucose 4-epimerase